MRQITIAAGQGYVIPPYSGPRRSKIVPPIIVTEPGQSIAFNPSSTGVLGMRILR
jgi:hypothetical protein